MTKNTRDVMNGMKKSNDEYSLTLPNNNIDLSELLSCVELALTSSNVKLKQLALSTICTSCQHIGLAFGCISTDIVRILSGTKDLAPVLRWETFLVLNRTLGVASTVHLKFSDFTHSLIKFLQEDQDNAPDALIHLVVSLMSTSMGLLEARNICALQTIVCAKAVEWRPSLNVLRILNALLKYSHDEVPTPIQVAKGVFERNFLSSDPLYERAVSEGLTLCMLYTRNRLPTLARKTLLNSNNSDAVSGSDDNYFTNGISSLYEVTNEKQSKVNHNNAEDIICILSDDDDVGGSMDIKKDVNLDYAMQFFNPE